LAESQAFVDGNKRAGLAAAYTFLALNGYRLVESDERLFRAMLAISRRDLDKVGLGEVFRGCATVDGDE
jgi:death-on-curing protein